jgi:hypothetical protein
MTDDQIDETCGLVHQYFTDARSGSWLRSSCRGTYS